MSTKFLDFNGLTYLWTKILSSIEGATQYIDNDAIDALCVDIAEEQALTTTDGTYTLNTTSADEGEIIKVTLA